ncbi:hypothetical protein QBC39DRAFT_356850 [Podospora conica]|nr:hypothetical protein QBC39DRAFT_356850 [Schizothecium conicum]
MGVMGASRWGLVVVVVVVGARGWWLEVIRGDSVIVGLSARGARAHLGDVQQDRGGGGVDSVATTVKLWRRGRIIRS